jgi:glycosyltransferase involved in cell wall biosynthesis
MDSVKSQNPTSQVPDFRPQNKIESASLCLRIRIVNIPTIRGGMRSNSSNRKKGVRDIKIVYLVHQFYPEFYTGTEKFVLSIARHIRDQGHEVKVITYSFLPDSSFTETYGNLLMREFTYNDIPIISFKHLQDPKMRRLSQLVEDQDLTEFAEYILLRESPDLVHVAHPMRVSEFIAAAKRLGIPYLITLTDFFFMCPKGILKTKGGKLCFGPVEGGVCSKLCPDLNQSFVRDRYLKGRDYLFSANKVIAPSHFLADIFRREYNDLEIEVIPYGIDEEICNSNNKWYQDNDQLTFCYAGSLYPHKGLHILLEAFSRIDSKKAFLKVYGSGKNIRYLKKIRELARKTRRIKYCGVYDENQVGEIFSQVDMLIVPSLWHENCPLVIHEALASNLPVIASKSSGITELVKDGVNGFTFRLGSVDHLTEILNKVIMNPKILNQLKMNMRNENRPSAREVAERYVEKYLICGGYGY